MPRAGPQPGAAWPRACRHHMNVSVLTGIVLALTAFVGVAVAQTPFPTPAAATPTAVAANTTNTNVITTTNPLTNYTAQILGQNLTVFAQSVRIPNALFASRACQVRQHFHLRYLSNGPVDCRGRAKRVGAAWKGALTQGCLGRSLPRPPFHPPPPRSSTWAIRTGPAST